MNVAGKEYKSVWFEGGSVFLVDQQKLPSSFEITSSDDYSRTASLIRDGVVRGPLSAAAAAAFGIAQASAESELKKDPRILELARDRILASSPASTVVKKCAERAYIKACVSSADAEKEAARICDEIISQCKKLSECGREIVNDGNRIAVHCEAGWLASIDWGTALGIVFTAKQDGKNVSVMVDQSSLLALWELANEGVENRTMEPNSLAHYAQNNGVDAVIADAERVLPNGDVISPIGALEKAIVAKEFGIPFYAAAPSVVFGKNSSVGDGFDALPAKYVSGIITPYGIISPEEPEISKLLRTF